MNYVSLVSCRRLLQLAEPEGEPAGKCYEPNERGQYAEGMKIIPDALKLPGYRLPTETEWEYACRGRCSYQSLLRPIGGTPREVCLVLDELPGSNEAVRPAILPNGLDRQFLVGTPTG